MSETNNRPLSTADKLLAARATHAEQQEKVIENIGEYQKALNGMAASEYGEHVLKIFVRALGVFTVKSGRDAVALVEAEAKRAFYLQYIRPHLDPAIRQKIEG